MSLTPGFRLGPYEILSALGAGGMGEVYRARDTKLGREVAIKVLPEAFATDAERVARFQREAQLLALLNHSNIAAIYGFEDGPADAGPHARALVLELIEGPTLADRIAQGPIPLDEVLPIAKQIAEALEAAHDAGVIHRDLKPANIKVRPDGTVKVLDFGLAKAIDPTASSRVSATMSPTLSMHATQAGIILGTAAYMSPEQAAGKAVDKRSDVWAFGVVLLEMLTGRQVFGGETVSHVLASVLKDEPQWATLPPNTPAPIRRLLRRCLEKDRKRRLADAADVRIEIEEAFATPAPEVRPAGPTRRIPPVAVAAVCGGALTVLALGGWIFMRPVVPAELVQFVVLPPENQQFAAGPGLLSLSADGRRLAFVTQTDNTQRLWVRSLGSLTAQQLPGTEDAWQPAWSPDGRYLAFGPLVGGNRTLKKIDVSGGAPIGLTGSAGNFTAWSGRGIILFTRADGTLAQIPESGGSPVGVTQRDELRHETGHNWPVFLPDGRRFVFLAVSSDFSKNALYLASIDAPGRTHLLNAFSSVAYASGYLLYQREGTLMAQPFDESKGRLTGDATPLIENVRYNPDNGRAAFSASANGVLAYRTGVPTGAGLLTWFDAGGKSLGTLGPEGAYSYPQLSPDRSRVVTTLADLGRRTDLWLIDVERGIPSRFTFDPANDDNPIWRPDGTHVAFTSNRHGHWDLYQRALSGGAAEDEVLFESPEDKEPTGFSPDGKILLFNQSARSKRDIWALPMAAPRKPFPVLATPFDERSATFSPDGRWMAYDSDEAGTVQVYVQPFPLIGGKVRLSTTTGSQPRWSADGKTVFYSTSDLRLMAVDVSIASGELRAGASRELFGYRQYRPNEQNARNYAVDPSGQRFLLPVLSQTQGAAPITVVLNWPRLVRK